MQLGLSTAPSPGTDAGWDVGAAYVGPPPWACMLLALVVPQDIAALQLPHRGLGVREVDLGGFLLRCGETFPKAFFPKAYLHMLRHDGNSSHAHISNSHSSRQNRIAREEAKGMGGRKQLPGPRWPPSFADPCPTALTVATESFVKE